jgi:hypothetical protein
MPDKERDQLSEDEDEDEVDENSEESFPGSDPPPSPAAVG